MSRKTFRISISVIAAVILALIGMNIALDSEKTWDVCYDMANRGIEWTWAGK